MYLTLFKQRQRQSKISFVFGLVSRRLRLLEFFKKETAFSNVLVLLVPVQCFDEAFLYLIFAQSRKIFRHFKMQEECENIECEKNLGYYTESLIKHGVSAIQNARYMETYELMNYEL